MQMLNIYLFILGSLCQAAAHRITQSDFFLVRRFFRTHSDAVDTLVSMAYQFFVSANQTQFAIDNNAYYDPYMRLYYFSILRAHSKSPGSPLITRSLRTPTMRSMSSRFFTVELDKYHVLIVEAKAPAFFAFGSN